MNEREQKFGPDRIFLQWHGDGEPDEHGTVCEEEVSWCKTKIFDHDIEYVRAALSEPQPIETQLRETVQELQRDLAALEGMVIVARIIIGNVGQELRWKSWPGTDPIAVPQRFLADTAHISHHPSDFPALTSSVSTGGQRN